LSYDCRSNESLPDSAKCNGTIRPQAGLVLGGFRGTDFPAGITWAPELGSIEMFGSGLEHSSLRMQVEVGLTETEARAQKREFRVAKLPMTSVARALEVDETGGFMKAIVDSETNQILGAAVLGIEGGEIMSALEIAMMGKLPYTSLRDGVFAHSTLAEALNNLFTAMDSGER
jgi:Pyridine nucleotide-disulphide oxidoreductase, dimerisation domain